jgi:hypothetical protein
MTLLKFKNAPPRKTIYSDAQKGSPWSLLSSFILKRHNVALVAMVFMNSFNYISTCKID